MAIVSQSHVYDALADRYDQAHRRWLRYAGGEAQCAYEGAATALLRPNSTVLDVACGTGKVSRRLLRRTAGDVQLVLLDNSEKMLRSCKDIPARRVLGCMMDLPFQSDQFDLLTCAWGVETVERPDLALAEFTRVTRPGGHICLAFCADRPAQSLMGSALRYCVSRRGRGRFLNHENLRDLALDVGARSVQTLTCSGPAAAMILHI
ncbi:methyltransferase domain-containing protein [Aliiroseovarius crassostreae]|uniref:methyltransferase domain-containing protein n=1 Tax=Aliiroseovarius crassostreae TaxID=154981 RepID=UPI003C7BE9EB